MKKLYSASLVLATLGLAGCGGADRTEPRPLTSEAADPSRTAAPANKTDQAPVPATAPLPNAQGVATVAFQRSIQAYLKIHNEAESKVPNLKSTDDPQKISDRERALGQMIMTLRAGAKPGEIFAPEYQPYFIQIVHDDFATRSARDRKALVSELPAKVKVDINTVYPTTLPLATFPAALLRKLPDLPPELEYRIVGRSLILRDVKANLIVDILRDVVPTIPS
jgi:hypothetical protein